MNKRLLLSLYDRSGLGAYMPVDLKGHELEVEEHMEKFAELIVRECMKVIIDDMDSNPDDEAFNDALDHAQSIIGEHFGVEL